MNEPLPSEIDRETERRRVAREYSLALIDAALRSDPTYLHQLMKRKDARRRLAKVSYELADMMMGWPQVARKYAKL